jgi:predicted P-loop ATPase/GTPase
MTEERNSSSSVQSTNYRLPSETTLLHAAKLSIVEDKPIMLDYWTASIQKDNEKPTCLIGIRNKTEKMLVKSEDEYTSPIKKFYKNDKDFIVVTENSIYIISADVPTRMIS